MALRGMAIKGFIAFWVTIILFGALGIIWQNHDINMIKEKHRQALQAKSKEMASAEAEAKRLEEARMQKAVSTYNKEKRKTDAIAIRNRIEHGQQTEQLSRETAQYLKSRERQYCVGGIYGRYCFNY